jgi:hypothetical protein
MAGFSPSITLEVFAHRLSAGGDSTCEHLNVDRAMPPKVTWRCMMRFRTVVEVRV